MPKREIELPAEVLIRLRALYHRVVAAGRQVTWEDFLSEVLDLGLESLRLRYGIQKPPDGKQ